MCSSYFIFDYKLIKGQQADSWISIYRYDIPVWCTTGMDPPREDCRPRAYPLERDSFLFYTPEGCQICFIIPIKIQNTKRENIDKQPEILEIYPLQVNVHVNGSQKYITQLRFSIYIRCTLKEHTCATGFYFS